MDNITRRDSEMPYIADENCFRQAMESRRKYTMFNNCEVWNEEGLKKAEEILRSLFGKTGKNVTVLPPLHCDYGFNIEVGDNFFANYNLTVLDVGKVTIGDNVMIAPNVSVYTAGHPLHPESRSTMYEYGIPITIGSNCWIGGSVTICPGVNIGEGCVIGAGSVVTKDIPPFSLAAGNPCRVIRKITEDDRQYYFKDRKFDDEAMKTVMAAKN
ncbi:MAG: sugar O-acetyltransferase [Oscillospiraceae bacterium]